MAYTSEARFKIGYQNIIFWSKVDLIRILVVETGISLQWMANQQEAHCIDRVYQPSIFMYC